MNRTQELRQRGARERGNGCGPSRPREPGRARGLVRATLDADPWADIELLRKAGHRVAEAEGLLTRLEGETKSLKARIQTETATAFARENLSEAKLERLALADARYADHMKGIAAAVEERELARHEYWAIKARLDWDNNAIQHANAFARLER